MKLKNLVKPQKKIQMNNRKSNFRAVNINNSKHLQDVMTASIKSNSISYYLILNTWDTPSKYLWDRLPEDGGLKDLNVIDIFDIPNVLSQMRSLLGRESSRDDIPYSWLSGYTQFPMLVVLHNVVSNGGKQNLFPRVVTYNGSIAAELGM